MSDESVVFNITMSVKKRRNGRFNGHVKLEGADEVHVTQPSRVKASDVQGDIRKCAIDLLDEALETLPRP